MPVLRKFDSPQRIAYRHDTLYKKWEFRRGLRIAPNQICTCNAVYSIFCATRSLCGCSCAWINTAVGFWTSKARGVSRLSLSGYSFLCTLCVFICRSGTFCQYVVDPSSGVSHKYFKKENVIEVPHHWKDYYTSVTKINKIYPLSLPSFPPSLNSSLSLSLPFPF